MVVKKELNRKATGAESLVLVSSVGGGVSAVISKAPEPPLPPELPPFPSRVQVLHQSGGDEDNAQICPSIQLMYGATRA